MAELGRREEVQDPLALNPREKGADRSLPTYGIRNPGQGAGNAASEQASKGLNVLTGLQAAIGRVFESSKDQMITEGKLQYMQGATEAEVAKSGNRYTKQGYQTMGAVNSATSWATQQAEFLEGDGRTMDSDSYRKYLMEEQKKQLANMPDDPAVRKAFLASYEDIAPRLMSTQVVKHNEYNEIRSSEEFGNLLDGTATTAPDSSVPVLDGSFRVSETPVAPTVDYNDNDADIAVRTMLAEAGGEGYEGMADVAHVMINRAKDGRWPSSIQDVALQDKQFSAWNKGAGGNDPLKYNPESPAYKNAMKVWQAVAGGLHVDRTDGATYYYSPKGMDKLVNDGDQANHVPSWLTAAAAERGGATVKLGNHIFAGKTRNGQTPVSGDSIVYRESTVPTDQTVQLPQSGEGDPQAVTAAEGIPTGQTPSGRGTRIQQFIKNSPLKPERKATVLADRIRRSLEQGDDTLFNDAGGIATLQGLNAKPSEIDEVLKAKERFDDQKDKNFDKDSEKARAEILAKATSGGFASLDDALSSVEEWEQTHKASPAEAKSLARAVAAEREKAGSEIVPLELRNLGADLYEGIQSGRYTDEQASQQILDYAAKNPKIKDSVINNFVEQMYSTDRGRKDKIRADLKTETDKQAKEQQVINRAQSALTSNSGLKGLTGTVRIPDPAVPGQTKEVTGEQYGIYALKTDVTKAYTAKAQQEGKQLSDYGPQITKDIYEKLAKQEVYDTEFGKNVASAVTGDITVKRDGKTTVNPDALQSFDVYMQLRNNPKIGSEYLAGMIPSEEARTLLETAADMYDQRGDIASALMKANTLLNQELKPENKIAKIGEFQGKLDQSVNAAVLTMANRDSIWARMGMSGEAISSKKTEWAMQNDAAMKTYVENQAWASYLNNPREPIAVSLKKAQDKLALNGVIVGGNVIIGDHDRKQRLDQVMGLEELGRAAPDAALENFMTTAGPSYWKELWNSQWSRPVTLSSEPALFVDSKMPTYGVTYNSMSNTLEVVLFKDNTRTETIGKEMTIDAKLLGDHYKRAIIKKEPNTFDKMYRKSIEEGADYMRYESKPSGAAEAGSVIGGMAKPK